MRARTLIAVAVACLSVAAAALATTTSPTGRGARACTRALGADWRCRTVTVPLDPSGRVPGHVRLAVAEWHRPGRRRPALLAFAGGPGGAAVPKATTYRRILSPLLAHRDLVLFDQRGTGVSGPLACRGVHGSALPAPVVRSCARQLGFRGRFFSSADSAADAEAVRRALHVPRVLLYGVSYGTKTATDYARRYPARVDGMVLDSVVVADTDPLYRRSAVAAARILRALCAHRHCAGDPVADLETLVHRSTDGRFHGRGGSISEGAVLNEIVEGGSDRFQLPGALHTAVAGNLAPLMKLADHPAPDVRGDTDWLSPAFSATTYLATTCEDASFPWSAYASAAARRRAAAAWLRTQSDSAYAPFDHRVAAQYGVTRLCLDWPGAHRRPALAPLPDVPTILFSGEDDALTPLEGAQEVAAELRRSRLVVVPGHDHVVLSTAGTAAQALRQWAATLAP